MALKKPIKRGINLHSVATANESVVNSFPFVESREQRDKELLGNSDAYSNLLGWLQQLGTNEDSDFLTTLLQAALGNLGKSGSAYGDLQQQLLKMYLDNLTKGEQRNFDEKALAEQRLYDLPMNQLARLMSTGMSRDAALQAIQGTQDSPLVGSGSEVTAGAENMPTPTERSMHGAQIALDAVGTVASLVGLGFSLPSAISQFKLLSSQSALAADQLRSYQLSGEAFEILSNAGVNTSEFKSVSDVVTNLTSLAAAGNSAASAFVQQGKAQKLQSLAPFASSAINGLYRSERASNDYDTSFGNFVAQQQANIDFKKVDASRVRQQILNMGEEFRKIQNEADYIESQNSLIEYHKKHIDAQVELLKKQGKLVEAQALQARSSAALSKAQTSLVNLDVEFKDQLYHGQYEGKEGIEWLTGSVAADAYNDFQSFVSAKDKKLWKHQINAIASDYNRLTAMNNLRVAFYKGALDHYASGTDEQKDLYNALTAMHECGGFQYFETELGLIESTYGDTSIPGSIGSFFDEGTHAKRNLRNKLPR